MLRRPPSLDVRHIDAKQPDDDLSPDAHPTLLCMFPSTYGMSFPKENWRLNTVLFHRSQVVA